MSLRVHRSLTPTRGLLAVVLPGVRCFGVLNLGRLLEHSTLRLEKGQIWSPLCGRDRLQNWRRNSLLDFISSFDSIGVSGRGVFDTLTHNTIMVTRRYLLIMSCVWESTILYVSFLTPLTMICGDLGVSFRGSLSVSDRHSWTCKITIFLVNRFFTLSLFGVFNRRVLNLYSGSRRRFSIH